MGASAGRTRCTIPPIWPVTLARAVAGTTPTGSRAARFLPGIRFRPLIARKNELPAGQPCRALASVLPLDYFAPDVARALPELAATGQTGSGFSERGQA
jgi:hypothetical protein